MSELKDATEGHPRWEEYQQRVNGIKHYKGMTKEEYDEYVIRCLNGAYGEWAKKFYQQRAMDELNESKKIPQST